jgi:D-inositol-3-phosphate glycosyltransferase
LISTPPRLRVATVSVHACPLAPPGAWETGGMNIYIREVSRHLSDLGVHVDVFTRRQDAEVPTIVPFAEHARVIHVPAGPAHYLPKESVVDHLPEFICNMRELATDQGAPYDLVHSHYWLSGRVAGYFKNAWHVPMVAMFHTLAELKNEVNLSADERESVVRIDIERLTVATADRVVASTPIDRSHLTEHYGALDDRISIVPCGVDLEHFVPGSQEQARAELGLTAEKVILFVGRIQQLKGIDVLIRAAAELERNRADRGIPSFRVVIVGGRASLDGDDPEAREMRRLRALAEELGVSHLLQWQGAVEHEDLPRYYRAADVTVMPSTYESFGLVAVESMACGTPVVAARVGGLQATVQDGVSGYLLEERDPALYADRIGAIFTDGALRDRLGEQARHRAEAFGWRHVAHQLLDLYYRLLETPEMTTLRPSRVVHG